MDSTAPVNNIARSPAGDDEIRIDAFLAAQTRNDAGLARAIRDATFGERSVAAVAQEHGIPRKTLADHVARFRMQFGEYLIDIGRVPADLAASADRASLEE